MRRVVQDRTGQNIGAIDDMGAAGQVVGPIVGEARERIDTRPDTERTGTITIRLPMLDARWVIGRKVAIFPVEE